MRPTLDLRRSLLALLPLLLLPTIAFAQSASEEKPQTIEKPFLWMIEGDTPSFLYGTIHLPDERVTTLPDVVVEAVGLADAVYGELALDMSTQMKIAQMTMLGGEDTLESVMPKETYARLAAYLEEKGGSIMALSKMKPWVAIQQLLMIEYPEVLTAQPVDAIVQDLGRAADKEVGGIEKAEEQIGAFDAFTYEEQSDMIAEALDEIEKASKDGKRMADVMMDAYVEGDLDALVEIANEEKDFENDPVDQKFEKLFIIDRNHVMVERMLAMMKENEGRSYFFAVGSLHYPGEDGILALMEKEGHELRRLSAADAGTLAPAPVGAGAGD